MPSSKSMMKTKKRLESFDLQEALRRELERLQQLTCGGYEVKVEFLPNVVKYHDGKKLAEEVVGNSILIYEENPQKAIELVRHGFAEWLLNQHTKYYRQFINKLIELFEEQQYERKEKIIQILAKLLIPTKQND